MSRSSKNSSSPVETQAGRPWGPRELPGECPELVRIGPLKIWLRSRAGEIRVAVESPPGRPKAVLKERALVYAAPDEQEISEEERWAKLEELSWKRYAFHSLPPHLEVVPITPNRPLFLSTETLFDVRPGAQARVYVSVPAWASLRAPQRQPENLLECATTSLSNTWFGDFLEGELCFWTPTRARSDHAKVPTAPHLVTCPIQITNRSDEPLGVDKLCLRIQHATIFQEEDRLWADETRISYQGGGAFSRIRWSGNPPSEAPKAKKISAPRETTRSGLTAWTFDQLGDNRAWRVK